MIWLWIIIGIIGLLIWWNLFFYGIKMCFRNNALGVFLLSIALPVFGIILGLCLLWNNKKIEEGTYLKDYYKIIKEKNKEENEKKRKVKMKKWQEK